MTLEESWRDPSPDTYTLTDHASVTNPVITKDFVTDIADMIFVADPFVVKDGGTYYMFFEAYYGAGVASLVYATSSDALNWTYGGKVLLDGEHWLTSYPFVFKVDGEWWLIHNDNDGHNISLYRPITFPNNWTHAETIFKDSPYTLRDVSIFQWDGYFYVLAGNVSSHTLRMLYSPTLQRSGTLYSEHPAGNILSGLRNSRPAGRPVVHPEVGIDIFVQDSVTVYGNKVRAFRIANLSPTTITITEKAESPLLDGDGTGWNATGMHNLDRVDSTLSIVDGNNAGVWAIGIYRDTP